MKRQYSSKQLAVLDGTTREYRDKVRKIFARHKAEVTKLSQPTERMKYTPDYHTQLLKKAREEALTALRTTGEELRDMLAPALAEKALHSKAFYLQDASFSEPVPSYPDKEKTAMLQALRDVSAGMKQLTTLARLQRLDDDSLVDTAELAASTGDVGLAGLALEEAVVRKSELVKLRVSKAVDSLSIPEAETAEQFFDLAEDALLEISDTLRVIQNPSDNVAYAALRSREIREQELVKETLALEEKQHKERNAQQKAEAERKTAAAAYLKDAPELPPAA